VEFKGNINYSEWTDFQTVLRAAEEIETAQGNIQDCLQLDEGDPGFQLLKEKGIASVVFCYLLPSALLLVYYKRFH
jgi:hypothetical protein